MTKEVTMADTQIATDSATGEIERLQETIYVKCSRLSAIERLELTPMGPVLLVLSFFATAMFVQRDYSVRWVDLVSSAYADSMGDVSLIVRTLAGCYVLVVLTLVMVGSASILLWSKNSRRTKIAGAAFQTVLGGMLGIIGKQFG
jgi:hypothetical protein